MRWVADEEESFGRTLDRGTELLAQLVDRREGRRAPRGSTPRTPSAHDTYGFPYDLTKELLAEQGLSVDDEGFEALMEQQRERARAGRRGDGAGPPRGGDRVRRRAAPATRVRRLRGAARARPASPPRRARATTAPLVKLEESPFYPEGGGQVADSRRARWRRRRGRGRRRLPRRRRPGDPRRRATSGELRPGDAGRGRSSTTRPATRRCATTPPPTCCTRRCASASAPTCARRARRCAPTSCASTSPTARRSRAEELRAIEDRVNDWIKASRPVRALQMARAEAEALGAMALFGEKYGDWVRVVEVDDVSRELCGGTHVANTAEVGIFAIVSEGSSAANVRRIEALTGPAAIDWFREPQRRARPRRASCSARRRDAGRAPPQRAAERLAELEAQVAELDREAAGAGGRASSPPRARRSAAIRVVAAERGERRSARAARPRRPDQAAPRRRRGRARRRRRTARSRWSPASARARSSAGLSAAEVIREAGGGRRRRRRRARRCRPGRRPRPERSTRRSRRRARRSGERSIPRRPCAMRVLAIDHGAARAGAAICDPSGDDRAPARRDLARRTRRDGASSPPSEGAELIVVGLPVSLDGAERDAGRRGARVRRPTLGELAGVPVETYDERLTTRMAERSPRAPAPARRADALAAAHLLESYLQREREAARGAVSDRRLARPVRRGRGGARARAPPRRARGAGAAAAASRWARRSRRPSAGRRRPPSPRRQPPRRPSAPSRAQRRRAPTARSATGRRAARPAGAPRPSRRDGRSPTSLRNRRIARRGRIPGRGRARSCSPSSR